MDYPDCLSLIPFSGFPAQHFLRVAKCGNTYYQSTTAVATHEKIDKESVIAYQLFTTRSKGSGVVKDQFSKSLDQKRAKLMTRQ